MAHKTNSAVLAQLIICSILIGQAFAGREIPADSKDVGVKKPEWFTGHDGSFLSPGLGRVYIPPGHYFPPYTPSTGTPSTGSGSTGSGLGPSGGSYVPGADDTFVPNPGYEVPNPGSTPASVNP